MSTPEGFDRLREAGIVAVIRADRPEHAVRVAQALLEGGVWAIELTFTTPGAAEALAQVHDAYGDRVYLGAGTIREPDQVDLAVRAGAQFLVTPHLRPDLLDAMLATGLPCVPGVFTPSEVAQALDRGAQTVKLFPASTGGPRHLRSLRGPFPKLRAVPTGGIDRENLRAWFEAGALAVGMGSELCPPSLIAEGKWDELARRAKGLAQATRDARSASSSMVGWAP